MQPYAIRFFNFMRFGQNDNSIVFDLTESQKNDLNSKNKTMDEIYDEVIQNPSKHISNIQKNGFNHMLGICGLLDGNLDRSNGVGKSTIFEGICYVLYDRIIRKNVNTDKTEKAGLSVVTRLNSQIPDYVTESYVEMIFEEQGKIYHVKRGRTFTKSHKSHKPYLMFNCINEDEIDSHSGHRTSDTNEAILEIVNDYDIFVNSVMFGQKDSGKFLVGTDKIRKEMIVNLLHLEDVISGCLKETRQRKSDKEKQINSTESQINLISENIKNYRSESEIKELIKQLTNKIEKCSKEIEQSNEALNQISQSDIIQENEKLKQKKIETNQKLQAQKSQKESQLKEWKILFDQCKNNHALEQNNLDRCQSKGKKYHAEGKNVKTRIESFDLDEQNKNLQIIAKAKQAKPKREQNINELRKKKSDLCSAIAVIDSNISQNKKELNLLKDQIRNVQGEEFVCDKCKSVVTRTHIEQEIKTLENNIETKENDKVKQNKVLSSVEEDLLENESKMKNIEKWLIKESEIKAKIQKHKDDKELLNKIKESVIEEVENQKIIKTKLEEIKKQQDNYSQKMKEIDNQYNQTISNLKSEMDKMEESHQKIKTQIDKIEEKKKEINNRIKTLNSEQAQCNTNIGSYKQEIKNMLSEQNKLKELKKLISEQRQEFNHFVLLDNIFGLEGIQTRIVNKYLPLLNLYIKEFLDVLSNGEMAINLFVNNKSQIDIDIKGNTGNVFNMLSGGEQELARLAVAIGLALLSFSRSVNKPEIICLDEIFGSLDNAHIDSVFHLLDKLRNKFNRVLVISHNVQINERIGAHILIEKQSGDKGMSHVREIEQEWKHIG